MKTRGRDSEQAHSREVEIHKRYAHLIEAAQHARRFILTYESSLVGVHCTPILEELRDALREVDA